ncbi:PfkB family carbohydrate kinase [Amycolatopsis alkalitolerans]|uniref:PfkB family carbohydrate kinase n=1 Tax=Amycolatopsis alkalitolerans TaxID=2547244 RepID=UPI0026AA4921
MTSAFDVVTMGRIGVDIYPLQTGVVLEDVTSFGKYLGGSATNVAAAAARYGRRCAVITKTGADPFGRFIHRALCGYGVDDRFVGTSPQLPTPVTFCEIFPPDDFPLYFYRFPKAPDLDIVAGNLDFGPIRAAKIFWVTCGPGTGGERPGAPARGLGLFQATGARWQPSCVHWGQCHPGSPRSVRCRNRCARNGPARGSKAYETYAATKRAQRHYL